MGCAYLVISALAVLPVLVGYSVLGGDTVVHARWQAQFAPLVWHGVLYPRWLPEMNSGFGSPAFLFYPPMLQWLGSLFWPILPEPTDAVVRLCLAVGLASAIGAMGCRCWLRALELSWRIASFGGLVFVLMPYRLFVDFYQRGALAELVGISAMPWLLFCAVQMKRYPRRGWAGYALAVASILYCHLPAALMGLAMSSLYVLALSQGRNLRLMGSATVGTLMGLGLAAPCIVPALSLLHYLPDTTAMFGARNQPTNWLLFARTDWLDPALWLMVIALCSAALTAGIAMVAIAWRKADAPSRTNIAFMGIVVVVVAVLNTQVSAGFWALQTPLSRIQFPFRLLSLQAIALTGLVALAIGQSDNRLIVRTLWLAAPMLLLFDAGLIGYQHWRDTAGGHRMDAVDLANTADTSEYVLGDTGLAGSRFGSRAFVTGYRYLSQATNAETTLNLPLHQFAFTGWECKIDAGAWGDASRLPAPTRLATCIVPPGRHRVEARLPASNPERWGNWIGLFTAIILFSDALRRRLHACRSS
ncbi:hypothetical protein WSK_2571 [Novosphingobium sp. Rr 2-17]|uniref:6-pyruvoyl-tetrahydropterin synthase-related protein n=1 Tax=Novosphingobium sp. Rr 2-17 TaxID=555793 RepID=UPI0002698202|nr:6-pyruvoyl-tetrahydropterin synthase-related protein [Novosphingobium sp. Rr 2-17]EIZ79026.1 hypothetical protein WSK_2571 [Novosphingobium sp. Rr 2-17]